MARSIAVVLGSYALSILLVLSTDPLLSHLFPADFVKGHIPSASALAASTGFFVVISIVCAAICARLAPPRPGRHVLWFFAIGEVMGIAATIPNWSKGWPHWYWLSWLLTWPISCWIGVQVGGSRKNQAAAIAA